jgi:hypothetical protein
MTKLVTVLTVFSIWIVRQDKPVIGGFRASAQQPSMASAPASKLAMPSAQSAVPFTRSHPTDLPHKSAGGPEIEPWRFHILLPPARREING